MSTMNPTVLNQPPPAETAALPMTQARRAVLAVGVPLCLALTAYTGLDLVAQIGQGHYGFSYAVPASARQVSVHSSGGDLALRQVAGGQASFAGTAHYSLVRPGISVRMAGGQASFGYGCPIPAGNCGLDATIGVPAGTAVSLSSGGGGISATGITGAVELSTGGGDITADRVTGALTLRTGGGSIQATAVASVDVTAGSGGGDIEITFTRVPRDVQVSTGGGNITIIVPPGSASYHVAASTGGGNTTDSVPINSSSPNAITATSGGGDITIRQAI